QRHLHNLPTRRSSDLFSSVSSPDRRCTCAWESSALAPCCHLRAQKDRHINRTTLPIRAQPPPKPPSPDHPPPAGDRLPNPRPPQDRKSTRLYSSHVKT